MDVTVFPGSADEWRLALYLMAGLATGLVIERLAVMAWARWRRRPARRRYRR